MSKGMITVKNGRPKNPSINGAALLYARTEANLSRPELSRMLLAQGCKVSEGALVKYERNIHCPPADKLKLICKLLRVEVDKILLPVVQTSA